MALASNDGIMVAFVAVSRYASDRDAIRGLAAALQTTVKLTMTSVLREGLSEIIVWASDGYLVTANAGRFALLGAGRNVEGSRCNGARLSGGDIGLIERRSAS